MKIEILTLFPELFGAVFSGSIIKKALETGTVKINLTNIRDFADGKHRITDDKPYGGGSGMIMMAPPIVKAIEAVNKTDGIEKTKIILLSPQGRTFDQAKAKELSDYNRLILVCGHYGGVDERVLNYIDEELSIGDYVLTGGEIPAMAVVDAVVRLLPGVVGKADSITTDSHWNGILMPPLYTRPYDFRGFMVPEVLVSGNHSEINKWKKRNALKNTRKKRPDLLERSSDGKHD